MRRTREDEPPGHRQVALPLNEEVRQMGFMRFPFSITLEIRKTRTGWQIIVRVKFLL